jgi:hypothetical protein
MVRPDQSIMEALHRFWEANCAVVRKETPTSLLPPTSSPEVEPEA